MMSIVTLITMLFLGFNGKNRGVINYKFAIEKFVLTLGLMPNLATFAKDKLVAFMPETLAAVLAVILGIVIVFSLLTLILGKITKIPEYEYTGTDRMLGFFLGMLKGFCVIAFMIMFYGIFFIDTVIPEGVTKHVKENFVNSRMDESIDYYRTTVYSIYVKASGARVEDLYVSKEELLKETEVKNYVPWTDGYVYVPPKPAPEKEKKEDNKFQGTNPNDLIHHKDQPKTIK